MSLADHFGIISEVDDAIAQGSPSRRGEILSHVTTLFLTHSERYSEDEVALFDGVIARLAADIELAARALLAERLAAIANAPTATIRMLALDDAIEVAQPVLTQSPRIDARTLIDVARTKSVQHLLALARRPSLDESVTDILAERGDREVGIALAENQGARLSERG